MAAFLAPLAPLVPKFYVAATAAAGSLATAFRVATTSPRAVQTGTRVKNYLHDSVDTVGSTGAHIPDYPGRVQ